jgi:hypothetical protein
MFGEMPSHPSQDEKEVQKVKGDNGPHGVVGSLLRDIMTHLWGD